MTAQRRLVFPSRRIASRGDTTGPPDSAACLYGAINAISRRRTSSLSRFAPIATTPVGAAAHSVDGDTSGTRTPCHRFPRCATTPSTMWTAASAIVRCTKLRASSDDIKTRNQEIRKNGSRPFPHHPDTQTVSPMFPVYVLPISPAVQTPWPETSHARIPGPSTAAAPTCRVWRRDSTDRHPQRRRTAKQSSTAPRERHRWLSARSRLGNGTGSRPPPSCPTERTRPGE